MKREILQNSPPVIRDFLTYNEAIKGKSALSVNEYYCDLLIFFRYILLQRGIVTEDTPDTDVQAQLEEMGVALL